MLTEIEIQNNWTKFKEIIDTEFDGERKEKLNEMYDYFEERMIMAPASGREHFHNAFPGGYVDHVLNVINGAVKLMELWEAAGNIINFTREELIFSAMHHDLYKVGDMYNDYYVVNDSQWHREHQGLIYKFNEKLMHNSSFWRTLYLLSQFGIKYTEFEQIGMLCADGMYAVETETVLKQHELARQIRTNLPIIIHHADMWATRLEHDRWEMSRIAANTPQESDEEKPVMFKKKNIAKLGNVGDNVTLDKKEKLFDDLFK